MVQLKTTKWNPGQNKPLSLCQLHHFMNIISRSDVIRNFFRSWLTKWITSHKTFARNVLPAKPFISHGATGLGCDPLVARLCTQPCSTDTPRCFSQHALGKSHYKAFFKWQHLSWRVWVWLDLSQNQYIHSVHLQDKKKWTPLQYYWT